MHHYTKEALGRLDQQIVRAEERLSEALLSMGSGAEADNNTWHDNPAFEQAKSDVDQATTSLAKLKNLRTQAVVFEPSNSTSIEVGSTVKVEYSDGEEMVIAIGGHFVAREMDAPTDVMEVSTSSPIGSALLHHKAGDVVDYSAPNGKKFQVTIIEVM